MKRYVYRQICHSNFDFRVEEGVNVKHKGEFEETWSGNIDLEWKVKN